MLILDSLRASSLTGAPEPCERACMQAISWKIPKTCTFGCTCNSFLFPICFSPAVLYPAIPEVEMDAIMKMGEAIQGRSSILKGHAPKHKNEEPLKLKSISELTPQENVS